MPVQEEGIRDLAGTVREDVVCTQEDPPTLAPGNLHHLEGTSTAHINDRQHLEIKRRQQYLRTAIIMGAGMDQIIAYAKDLIRATLFHFDSEEGAMDAHGFQGIETHRLFHAEMIESLKEMSSDMEHRRISSAIELMRFFDGRLTYHMDVEDAAWERELRTTKH